VACETIDEQVINTLMQLKPPAEWRDQITQAMSEILGEQNLEQRLTEIRATIERMDFRWDQGFITDKADYLEKRIRLQQELEQLSPIPMMIWSERRTFSPISGTIGKRATATLRNSTG
jgi:hypothetical protein